MCAQRRLRLSVQANHSLHYPHEDALDPWLPIGCSATTDHTARMCKVILVFAGRTCSLAPSHMVVEAFGMNRSEATRVNVRRSNATV